MKIRMCILALMSFVVKFSLCCQEINVLYLGNSYVGVNNLPQTVSNLLEGSGRKMYFDNNTPGGCTLKMHSENTASLNKIRQGGWDFVVLQEQSQMPSIDYYRYNMMYPAAASLNDTIKKYNPDAKVVFYMTWGRKDGGQQCEDYGEGLYCSADFVDFDHMQDTMTNAYCQIANELNSIVAPVGEAWRKTRHETDIELFSSDGSHPSVLGTYLTALVFHAVFWNESPLGLPYLTISPNEAYILQKIADKIVFNGWDYTDETPFINVDIFPNPTSQNITIKGVENSQIIINDVFGKTYISKNLPCGGTIGISYLPIGIYFVNVVSDKCNKSFKLLKNK